MQVNNGTAMGLTALSAIVPYGILGIQVTHNDIMLKSAPSATGKERKTIKTAMVAVAKDGLKFAAKVVEVV